MTCNGSTPQQSSQTVRKKTHILGEFISDFEVAGRYENTP